MGFKGLSVIIDMKHSLTSDFITLSSPLTQINFPISLFFPNIE